VTDTRPRLLNTLEVHNAQMASLHCVGVELGAHHPEKLAQFYVDALSFTIFREAHEELELKLGDCLLRLRRVQGRPMPSDSRSHDRWFRHLAIVVRNMAAAVKRVHQFSPRRVSTQPETLPSWNEASGEIEAFYFRDPEGHPLELIHFPADKGRPQWQRSGNDLFQGVDHTAIVVGSALASIAFYRTLALLTPIAVAHNYGAEQARLSQLDGADLRATSLGNRATRAPSLELLEYTTPRDGRAMPPDTSRNDVWWSASIFARHSQAIASARSRQAPDGPCWIDPDGHRAVLR
jgi:catechol 2,3-dioxygenase-like lactoylglutathione lyase family enzyme